MMPDLRAHTFRSWMPLAGVALSAVVGTQAAELDFYRDVHPFLKANCIACHNKTTAKANLEMETPEAMRKGGESGPAVIPGQGAESLLVHAARHTEDLVMPPKNNKSGATNLTVAEIDILRIWIDQGANHSVPRERSVAWQPLAPDLHPIYSVAVTRDGRLAACGRGNRIFVYDLATRRFATQLVDEALPSGIAHRAFVQSLAFSPDGARLASSGYREVKIWRQEGRPSASRPADGAGGAILSALTDDGKRVVRADPAGALLVVDAMTGSLIRRVDGVNPSGIKLMSLSPDGSKAVVLGVDSALSVWNLEEGRILGAHGGVMGIAAVAWCHDGNSIATGGDDRIVHIWSLPDEGATAFAAPRELAGASAAITSLQAGAAAEQLLSGSQDGKVQVWNVTEARILRKVISPGLLGFALSTDGGQLVTGAADGALRLWNMADGQPIHELRGGVAASRQLAALEWTLAAQGMEQEFHRGEVARITAQNTALDELSKKANDTIAAMNAALPEKQKALEAATEARIMAQKTVEDVAALVAAAPGGKPDSALAQQQKDAEAKRGASVTAETSALAAVSAAESNVTDAEVDLKRMTDTQSANTTELAARNASLESSRKAQETATANLAVARETHAAAVAKPLAVRFSSDGQQVAAVFDDGAIRSWATATGAPIAEVAGPATTAAGLIHHADGFFVGCTADGATVTLNTSMRWVLERVLGGEADRSLFVDRVNAVSFSPDGQTLAAGGGEPSRSGDISLFEVASGKRLAAWSGCHKDVVLSLDFSPEGDLLASGSADRIARVTELASGKPVNHFEAHTHYVLGVAFRADGRVLASAGADGVVNVWDMVLGERKRKIEGWSKEVTSLDFIGATNQIVTSSGDNQVRIVNDAGAEIRVIAKLPDFMQATAATSNGKSILGGGEDSVLRVWDGTNGQELVVFGR